MAVRPPALWSLLIYRYISVVPSQAFVIHCPRASPSSQSLSLEQPLSTTLQSRSGLPLESVFVSAVGLSCSCAVLVTSVFSFGALQPDINSAVVATTPSTAPAFCCHYLEVLMYCSRLLLCTLCIYDIRLYNLCGAMAN